MCIAHCLLWPWGNTRWAKAKRVIHRVLVLRMCHISQLIFQNLSNPKTAPICAYLCVTDSYEELLRKSSLEIAGNYWITVAWPSSFCSGNIVVLLCFRLSNYICSSGNWIVNYILEYCPVIFLTELDKETVFTKLGCYKTQDKSRDIKCLEIILSFWERSFEIWKWNEATQ